VKAAIVHDWLTGYAGSERVLEQILAVLPDASLYAVLDRMPEKERAFLGGRPVQTSLLDRVPGIGRFHRAMLPLMPFAVEQLDVSAHDVVVSSSHAVAKGVLTGPDQLHVCYCHTPLRYAWDLQHQYLAQSGLGFGPRGLLTRMLLHRLRTWDVVSANRVDRFVANSHFVARRIAKTYRREAEVIHPPVDVDAFTPDGERDDYYVTASRFVPYKCIDVIVEAFRAMPNRRLVVIGDGPDAARIRARAGANVTLLGHRPFAELREHFRRARAFVFCAAEDFGITPIEAQATGAPVIAFAGGALRETIPGLDGEEPCGVHFAEQTPAGVRAGVEAFERNADRITAEACRRNAERFSVERFRTRFSQFLEQAIAEHHAAVRDWPAESTLASR
jgi:glycosyltransferase involved in cell wall biosynthesis